MENAIAKSSRREIGHSSIVHTFSSRTRPSGIAGSLIS